MTRGIAAAVVGTAWLVAAPGAQEPSALAAAGGRAPGHQRGRRGPTRRVGGQTVFDLVHPRLVPGGVFVGRNVVNKRLEMEPFLRTILTHPALRSTSVSPSHEGLSISYKTR